MAYLIAAAVMTFSVLESHSSIASLFKCDIFALVCLCLDLLLLLHVGLHLICANKYLLTYFMAVHLYRHCVWDFKPMHKVRGHSSTESKAAHLGDKAPLMLENI